ncbi:hypothetical protein G4O51_11375 [Candidatus Bathyarchaeota archaeon A05DMB-2]|jgi:hypothetical protein|nr:hypothetical protein [Candidatus Bathyarchaeota archaeon A05DMB-2]
MPKAWLSALIAISIIAASALLGFYKVPLADAFAPTENANPRLIYWPSTIVWRQGDFLNIEHGWVNAKSIAWSPSGRYLLIYGRVYEPQLYSLDTDEWKVLIVNVESGVLAYNFSLDLGQLEWENVIQFAFSPDETKIFYVAVPNTEWLPQIFSVKLDGTDSTFVTYMNSTSVSSMRRPFLIDVTNDGFLVYTSCETVYNVTSGQYNYTSYIWKYNLITSEKSLVLQLEGMDKLITGLKVSPSNNKIAYTVGSEVWIVDINGAEPPINISSASDRKIAMFVDWTSNETMLTYSEINGTITDYGISTNWDSWHGNMTAVNLDGTNKHNILNGGYGLVWSPVKASIAACVRFSYSSLDGYPYLIDFDMPITPNPDSDGDGISDSSEIQNSLCPLDPTDVDMDYDEDGLTNLEEINYGTWLGSTDFDGDGLSDGVEVKVFKTDPKKADTDGDGVSDGLEAAATGLSAFVSVLPEGWIRMTLQWSNKTMYVSTNSSVLGVVFNSTSMALSISVGGPDGTTGIANITIPIEMVNSLSAVQVTLDNQPIDFQINQVGNNAQIYVEYHHSFHELTAHLQGGVGGADLTGILGYWWIILSVAIIAAASVIALIIIKRR